MWGWIIPIAFILVILLRIKKRDFFWKAKDGTKLTLRQFLRRWGKGVEGITPIQQTRTTLLSYPLVLGGVLTGIVIMILRTEWWLLLILSGSLPMTIMGLISTWQKYRKQKVIYDTMKELEMEKENVSNKE